MYRLTIIEVVKMCIKSQHTAQTKSVMYLATFKKKKQKQTITNVWRKFCGGKSSNRTRLIFDLVREIMRKYDKNAYSLQTNGSQGSTCSNILNGLLMYIIKNFTNTPAKVIKLHCQMWLKCFGNMNAADHDHSGIVPALSGIQLQ